MKKGFTLIELLLVLSVIAILIAISLPRYNPDFVVNLHLKDSVHRVTSDLRLTRRLAITHNTNYILKIFSVSHEYKIYKESVDPGNVVEAKSFNPNITTTEDKEFIFEALGNTSVLSDSFVSLTSNGHTYSIVITPTTGKINVVGL